MSDILQQAIVAIKTGDKTRAGQLLTQILQADARQTDAWLWLAHIASTEERRRACLERALALDPDHPQVRQALFDWILAEAAPAVPAPSPGPTPATAPAKSPALTPDLSAIAGSSLQDFLLQLTKNYNLLKEREAKYGGMAAPLDLLNQIEDYERAIALTEEAIERAAPLEELQAEFSSLNLQISTVIFVAQEPPRKPFKGLNPYRGLLKFTESEAQFFFGRNAAIQSLLNTVQYLVESKTSVQTPDIIAVLGPSGSGKSSLVRAGLIPALWAGRVPGSQQWPIKVMLPGPHPLDALAEVFIGQVGQNLAWIQATLNSGEKALHELIVESLTLGGRPEEAVFVLVIDQFEEAFTLCEDEGERRAFIDQLLYATQTQRNRSFVALTMRSDFYSKLASYKPLADAVTKYQMLISPMTEKELREAILLPAEAVGLELEKALVESLVKDTANAPGVLPLLQHALLELFHRRNGNLLTLEAYNEIGGVKGALAYRADSVINELTAEQQKIARRIFLRLVRLGEGAADTRRRATFNEVLTQDAEKEQIEAVVKTLADANLIVTDSQPNSDEVILDVSHEALIHGWPLLRHWLRENRVSLRIQQQVNQAAHEWEAQGQDTSYLYQGARLLELEEWVRQHPGELNPLEQTFLTAGMAERDREAAAEEARRQRELLAAQERAHEQAHAADRLRRQRLGLLGAGAIALILAVAAAIFGIQSNQNADLAATRAIEAKDNADLAATRAAEAKANADRAATREAEAVQAQEEADQQAIQSHLNNVAAEVRANLDSQLDLALLLGLELGNLQESFQMGDPVQAVGSLLASVAHQPHLKMFLYGHENYWVYRLAISPDGKTLASGDSNGSIALWDAAAGQQLGVLTRDIPFDVRGLAFSPNGKILVSNGPDNTIILWDVAGRQQQGKPLSGHETPVMALAFSPDGKTLASGDDEGLIILWDVATGQPRGEPLTGHENLVTSLAFNPAGTILASGSIDKRVILWDVAKGQPAGEPLTGHQDWVNSVVFSPDGKILASGSEDDSIILWDMTSEAPAGEALTGHQGGVNSLAFSPNSQTLASGSGDSTVILWDVATRQQRGAPLRGHHNVVNSIVFSRDGHILASTGNDSVVILWDLAVVSPLGTALAGHEGIVYSVAFSPDGKTLASGSDDGTIILWDIAGRRERNQPLDEHKGEVYSLAFNPDGKTLASSDSEGGTMLWDITKGQPRGEALSDYESNTVAFSPDKKTLALGGADGSIILWDVATGRQRGEPLTGHQDWVTSLAFSPDSQTLASTGRNEFDIILWDVATGQQRGQPLTGHGAQVWSVAFNPNPDLPYLASASEDSSIMLWDISAPLDPELGQDKNSDRLSDQVTTTLTGHKGTVYSVAFSPDGSTLASGGLDNTVILWDVYNALLGRDSLIGGPLTGHKAEVWSVAFSPDGKTLASGSADQTVILWDMNVESWRALACRRANRNLSQVEWDTLVGLEDIPYHRTCANLSPGAGVEETAGSN